MQIIRGDYGGSATAIGYLKLCRVINKRRRAVKISAQKERLYRALDTAAEELTVMKKNAVESVGEEHGEIYEMYLRILKSDSLRARLLSGIDDGASTEESVRNLISDGATATDGEFSSRHLKDSLNLLSRVLEDIKCPEFGELTRDAEQGSYIYVSDGEGSGELISILKKFKKGDEYAPVGVICANAGELRSAVAMELPSLLIPPDSIPDESFDGVTAILDCGRRRLILDPDLSELERYSETGKKNEARQEELSRLSSLQPITRDGIHIHLLREISFHNGHYPPFSDDESGSDKGILALTDNISPELSEKLQYDIYKKLAEAEGAVVVRLFEFPYEKTSSDLADPSSSSPSGLRGAGLFSLFRQVYKVQLKALLRAAAHGPISVILPSVSSRDELCVFRSILCEARGELKEDSLPFSEFSSVGIELSTPAAALSADTLCNGLRPVIINLDRLISLTSAAELRDPIASDQLKSGIFPALKLCSHVIDSVSDSNVQFALRGELAADPSLTHHLIKCGFKYFFLASDKIPEVKESVLSYRDSESQ